MPTGTTYNPPNIDAFIKSALLFNAQGMSQTVATGTTTNLDYALTDDCLLTGMEIIINNGNYGDTANLQILISGVVVDQFATNWNFPPTIDTQFDMSYPAKLLSGMTIRMAYTSTGTNNPFVAINYKLHKILF